MPPLCTLLMAVGLLAPAAEQPAVEQLARLFRIRVYDTFRADRDEYARRRAVADAAVAAWAAAGSPPDRQGLLVDWFDVAIRRSTPGSIGPLPELPDFSRPLLVPAEPLAEPPTPPVALGDGPRRSAGPPGVGGQPLSELPPVDRAMPLAAAAASQRTEPAGRSAAGSSSAGQPTPRGAGTLPLPPTGPLGASPAVDEPQRSSPRPPRAAPSHGVNRAELAARIAGTNLALHALEADLDQDRPWTAQQLSPLVDRLEILAIRQQDLAVFQGLISESERAQVGSLDSSQRAVSQLAARVFEVRSWVTDPGFAGTPAQRQAELERLDAISRRLAAIAGAK